jgi:hypothetical protein
MTSLRLLKSASGVRRDDEQKKPPPTERLFKYTPPSQREGEETSPIINAP